jgi:uncharacterized protein (DUF488 family)
VPPASSPGPERIATIGHSTRPVGVLIALLQAHGVTRLVDVRTVPRSRRHPQFNRGTLPATLRAAGIGYEHAPGLGGLRRPRPDSTNTGWRHPAFRGYADHMQTAEFAASLDALIALGRAQPVAIMCAEAVPWRCHRSLIADALVARAVPVEHIVAPGRSYPHRLTGFARVEGTRVTYPGPMPLALPLDEG